MARPKELIPGNCYFKVNFYDDALLFPNVHTLVFLRHEDGGGTDARWLFQEP